MPFSAFTYLQLRSRRCSCLAHRTPNRAHVAQGWFPSHRIFRLRHRSQAIIEDFRLCRVMAGLSCIGSPIVARLCKGRRFRSSALTASVGEEAAVDMMMTLAAASPSSSSSIASRSCAQGPHLQIINTDEASKHWYQPLLIPIAAARSILSNTHTHPPTRNIRGVSKPCLGGVVAKVKHKHLETWMRVSDATIHYDPDDAGVSMPLCQ